MNLSQITENKEKMSLLQVKKISPDEGETKAKNRK